MLRLAAPSSTAGASAVRVTRVLVTCVLGVSLLAACAQRPSPAPSSTPTATQDVPGTVAPLTGEPATGAVLSRPSLAAKIGNDVEARPQRGLERADLVFEELVEGGLTRYVAVWQSQIPEELGPLRSIRPMDPDIISPFGGLVAYSGGQQIFVDQMENTPVKNFIHGQPNADPFMYRSKDKPAPHNVILRAEKLIDDQQGLSAPPTQFEHAETAEGASALQGGIPVATIHATFSTSRQQSWAWDASQGVFLRSQQGKPDLDPDGKTRSATNVIVLRVNIDNQYQGVPKTVLIGSGTGYVATGGQVIPVTWSKTEATAPITLTTEAGEPILLAPGNAWVELVPLISGAEVRVE
ncbi:hypothetical protein M2390_002715 [Mycetocola sp. BIGb0189]|uniref:DUF3048 domain-containing protein n=1 Tax=Mycetocola sp. BIGb0189 TaxID=2940604 RepID=UPI002169B2D9|nr:DUF3048 domain-containing protein [Mycetocola sp. BIGb0189]MCS4277509.1 hypothetical protein [Mycetocola sp. BIGb0189]